MILRSLSAELDKFRREKDAEVKRAIARERERCKAAATSRLPRTGTAAYRELPLTGAFQSTFHATTAGVPQSHIP